ncbi:4'-phosphopantetheinyl transferase family protein [Variovorax beijingensis]|uniref:4'-phosphopantetheinyl transferase family protein n=1 Tax=Variovorax beijingensis TaxID=2496117 RepID=UPI00163A6E41|nr:4'-phosphopantetheinyl transferase superfamily protein [Variovorax beijingensis]
MNSYEHEGIQRPPNIDRAIPKRQAEFFFGRWGAGRALARIGLPTGPIPVGRTREPLWPRNVVGSITHSHGFAAAWVCRAEYAAGLGIDIERVPGTAELTALQNIALRPDEADMIDSLCADAKMTRPLLLTLLFSAKESFFKALSPTVKKYFDFQVARLVKIDATDRKLVLELKVELHPKFPAGYRGNLNYDLIEHDTVLTCLSLC